MENSETSELPPEKDHWSNHLRTTKEDILGEFYRIIHEGGDFRKLHIPLSDVFYVREAIHNSTGLLFSLEYVEKIMKEEGNL